MYINIWVHFIFLIDVIEAELSLHVGFEGSRDMILWERSYLFSTPGQLFFGFYFSWNRKTVWQHTLESIPQLLTNHPKSTRSLPIGIINKRRKKVKQDKKKSGGYFCHSEDRRDWWREELLVLNARAIIFWLLFFLE